MSIRVNSWLNIIEFSEFSVSGVYPEFIPESCSPDSQQGNVSPLALEFTLGVGLLACLPGVGGGKKSTKNADTFEQKSNFSNIFNSLSQNELRATTDEKRLYFRIKSAGSSNYRGTTFLLPGKKQPVIYVPIRPSQLTLKRSGNPLGE